MAVARRPMTDAPDLSPEEAADRWLGRLRLDRSDSTVASYRRRLSHFLDWCDDQDIAAVADLTAWALDEYDTHRRQQGLKAISLNNELTTLRLFVEYCERVGIADEGLAATIDPPTVPDSEESSDEHLDPDRARDLLAAYRDGDDQDTREHALFELTWWTGARKGGIRALDLDDVDLDEGFVRFQHRPDEDTPLKNGVDGERVVGLSDAVVEALRGYLRENRPTSTDAFGRRPLFSTQRGRAAINTLTNSLYFATVPCRGGPCPHGHERPTCQYYSRSKAVRCPSSVSPHPVRTGSIMWQLNRGLRPDRVAERVNATVEVIEQYYDKASDQERFRERRAADLAKLGFDAMEDDS